MNIDTGYDSQHGRKGLSTDQSTDERPSLKKYFEANKDIHVGCT